MAAAPNPSPMQIRKFQWGVNAQRSLLPCSSISSVWGAFLAGLLALGAPSPN
jgi:hypothetical protein